MTVSSMLRVVFIWKTIRFVWSVVNAEKGPLAGREPPLPLRPSRRIGTLGGDIRRPIVPPRGDHRHCNAVRPSSLQESSLCRLAVIDCESLLDNVWWGTDRLQANSR